MIVEVLLRALEKRSFERSSLYSVQRSQQSLQYSQLEQQSRQVEGKLEQQLTGLTLQGRQSDFVRINYSHCIVKDKVYLFWPQEWDLREEIRRKMLGMDYNPPHKNYMMRLYYHSPDKSFLIENLKWSKGGIPPVPRKGCLGFETNNQNRFYILGGIHDSRLDFYAAAGCVNVATLHPDSFNIQTLPKRSEGSIHRSNCLKPKMHYKLERAVRGVEEGAASIISGGYGRIFTNSHSLISYESYSAINELDSIRVVKIQKKNMRVVRLQRPLSLGAVGRYPVGSAGESEERFSDAVKDWTLCESQDSHQGQRRVLSVLEEDLRTREFKTDHKRQYLFGWDRTLRQRIYVPHCWSPELQIIAGGRLHLVNASLRAQKSNIYSMNRFIIPKEEDVISLCLDEDKLLMLAPAPLLPQFDARIGVYTLYEGSLTNLNDILLRRQLHLQERFEFKPAIAKNSLAYKTIFLTDDRIYILGGLSSSQGQRQDYLLQSSKNKLKLKVRKLESRQDSLEMMWPVVVKHNKGFVMYSLISQQKIVPGGGDFKAVQDLWRVKIQSFTSNDSSQQEITYSAPLALYQLDFDSVSAVPRKPEFDRPRMVKIVPYQQFTYSQLRQYLQKVLMGLGQFQDATLQSVVQILRQLFSERNEANLTEMIKHHHHKGNTFKGLVSWLQSLIQNQPADRQQHQELIRDIRELYSLLNKHLIEGVLPPDYSSSQLYRFVLEDQRSSKVKYAAIGPLMTTKLRFLRLRYKHKLSVCLNEGREEEIFFSGSGLGCQELIKDRIRPYSGDDFEEQPAIRKISVSYEVPLAVQ